MSVFLNWVRILRLNIFSESGVFFGSRKSSCWKTSRVSFQSGMAANCPMTTLLQRWLVTFHLYTGNKLNLHNIQKIYHDDDHDDDGFDDQNTVVFWFFWFHGSGDNHFLVDKHVSTKAMAEMSCGQSLPKERWIWRLGNQGEKGKVDLVEFGPPNGVFFDLLGRKWPFFRGNLGLASRMKGWRINLEV